MANPITKQRHLTFALTASALVLTAATAASPPRSPGIGQSSIDLERACQPAAMQAIAEAANAGITIGQIRNGPRFEGGVQLRRRT